jgi:hypothetical protein
VASAGRQLPVDFGQSLSAEDGAGPEDGCARQPWIAELLAHGLIRPSFVPPREIRELRDLTRYRVKLVEEHNRIHNRIHKVLEDACIKFDTVATDILGVSGRRIIQAILGGYQHPADLAYEVRGKMPHLRLALNGASQTITASCCVN